MTLLRIYTLHTWCYCTHDFTWVDNSPKQDSTQIHVSSFLIEELLHRGGKTYCIHACILHASKRDSTMGLRLLTQSQIQFKITIWFELCLQIIVP